MFWTECFFLSLTFMTSWPRCFWSLVLLQSSEQCVFVFQAKGKFSRYPPLFVILVVLCVEPSIFILSLFKSIWVIRGVFIPNDYVIVRVMMKHFCGSMFFWPLLTDFDESFTKEGPEIHSFITTAHFYWTAPGHDILTGTLSNRGDLRDTKSSGETHQGAPMARRGHWHPEVLSPETEAWWHFLPLRESSSDKSWEDVCCL